MISPEDIVKAIAWLATKYGKDLFILTTDFLQRQWARLFENRPVLFLGPKQSGKSSILMYLRNGKPYNVDKDGTIRTPDPTLVAAVVDKKMSIHQKSWIRIKEDLPGDQQLRAAWMQSVKDFHPVGIVYLIDGRDESKIADLIKEACREVFDVCYPDGPKELGAMHIFVSFSDQWANSPAATRSRQRVGRDTLEDELSARPLFAGVRTDVAVIHLSPHAREWNEAKRALEHFGTDLSK